MSEEPSAVPSTGPGAWARLVSQPLAPVAGAPSATAAAVGEPVLPGRFRWAGREVTVAEVLERWKSSGPAEGGERYLRRHWYRVRLTDGRQLTLYFERQAASRRQAKARWWVYTVTDPAPPPPGDQAG